MSSAKEKLYLLMSESVLDGTFRKAVFSKPVNKAAEGPIRIDVRPVTVKGLRKLQLTRRIGTQERHENVDAADGVAQMQRFAEFKFRDVHLTTSDAEWSARHGKKGTCKLTKREMTADYSVPNTSHNRDRKYLIPDGEPCPFLMATGIMSSNGRVRAQQYAKFRQINRYVEFIRDVVDHLPGDGTVNVVDFGCGKSYLTFATQYFFRHVSGRDVHITGLDRRQDVVDTCSNIVQQLKLDDIQFRVGDIADFQPAEHIHLAISLHACDTATDDALAAAVSWGTDVILAVPCCQHELAAQLQKDRQPLFSDHGILHEKFSSLATDAMRANLLDCAGYNTRVMEFIDMEHTAKNLLIRALKRTNSDIATTGRSREQMQAFCQQLAIPPLRLQQKLEEYELL
ncbi:MAG: SAM-dependent methyltransferase [Fuerstiella sp.]|nr:SAM-dependent methyltransferase [Fuerstiella sp.]MCP4854173.1 SAM-dependent methyltransferase [Fuerstiella sp.]